MADLPLTQKQRRDKLTEFGGDGGVAIAFYNKDGKPVVQSDMPMSKADLDRWFKYWANDIKRRGKKNA